MLYNWVDGDAEGPVSGDAALNGHGPDAVSCRTGGISGILDRGHNVNTRQIAGGLSWRCGGAVCAQLPAASPASTLKVYVVSVVAHDIAGGGGAADGGGCSVL